MLHFPAVALARTRKSVFLSNQEGNNILIIRGHNFNTLTLQDRGVQQRFTISSSYYFGFLLGSCWVPARFLLGSCQCHPDNYYFGFLPGSCWVPASAIPKTTIYYFGFLLGSCQCHPEDYYFGFLLGSCQCHPEY